MSDAPEPTWPIGFYAPGNYACTCALCGKQHIAAKRAVHCADCTIQACWATITQLRADLDAANERAEKAEAVAATAYGASLAWEQILQDDALWAAQDDIARSRVACIAAEADAAALRAQVERMREALANAAGALDSAGEELSEFANTLSRDPWQANHAYESAVQARAALAPAMPEGE